MNAIRSFDEEETEEVSLLEEKSENEAKFIFDANGGSGTVNPIIVPYGDSFILPSNLISIFK